MVPRETEVTAVTQARPLGRTVVALFAVLIMVGTGVAWGSVRSFEGGIFRFAARLSGHMPDDPFEALQVRAQPRARASVPRADRFASAVKTQATPLFFVLRWRKSSGWWRTCRRSCSRA